MYFDSICDRCRRELPQVEDTRHVLLTCPASRPLRMQLHRQLKSVIAERTTDMVGSVPNFFSSEGLG